MTFPSRVDAWYYLLIVAVCAALAASAVAVREAGSMPGIVVLVLITPASLGLPAWLLVATDYTVTDDLLIVRSGPFRWRIPRADILAVRPSQSVISGPALSLDRLEVSYAGGKSLVVSPADKAGFQAALAR